MLIALVTAVALAADPTSPGTLAAVDGGGQVWTSDDAGARWRPVYTCTAPPVDGCPAAAVAFSGGHLWVACGDLLFALGERAQRYQVDAPITGLSPAGGAVIATLAGGDRVRIAPARRVAEPVTPAPEAAAGCVAIELGGAAPATPRRLPERPRAAALLPRLAIGASATWRRDQTLRGTDTLRRSRTRDVQLFITLRWELDHL